MIGQEIYQRLIAEIKKRVHFRQEEFDLFAEQLEWVKLKSGEIWEPMGKVCHWMGFVNRGLLRQYYLKEDKEFTDFFFVEGDFMGNYISYLRQEPSPSITEALEPCELLVIPFAQLEALYERLPVVEEFSRIIGNEKLFQLESRSHSLLMSSPEERYRELMRQRPDLQERVPLFLIAQYLGIRPETLSRIRKRPIS